MEYTQIIEHSKCLTPPFHLTLARSLELGHIEMVLVWCVVFSPFQFQHEPIISMA